MATGVDWLVKQKKAELSELADHTGLKSYEKMKKNELEVALEDHLRKNISRYEQDSRAAPFYKGVDPASPVKHAGGKAVAGGMKEDEKEKEKKPRQRRQTIKAQASDEYVASFCTILHTTLYPSRSLDLPIHEVPSPLTYDSLTTSSSSTATPSRVQFLANRVPLPPSPAVLANKIDARTSSLRASLSNQFRQSRWPRLANKLRANLSSATSLTLLSLAIEALSLLTVVLPLKYAFSTPPVPAVGLGAIDVKLPDFFALLTMAFWGPVLTWTVWGLVGPLIGAWTVNLQGVKKARVDVVAFNVAKAGLAWLVFIRGGVGGKGVETVIDGVPGGTTGMLVGAGTGALAGVYEAILRK